MKKDAADRAAIVAALERQLKKGDKSLVGNKGYRRFLANPEDGGFRHRSRQGRRGRQVRRRVRAAHQLGPFAIGGDARLQAVVDRGASVPNDQKSVRDAADLPQARRDDPRPCRLQLPRARAEEGAGGSPRRREPNGTRASWPDSDRRSGSLTETEVGQDDKRFLLRSAPRPGASLALQALSVALPKTLRQLSTPNSHNNPVL